MASPAGHSDYGCIVLNRGGGYNWALSPELDLKLRSVVNRLSGSHTIIIGGGEMPQAPCW